MGSQDTPASRARSRICATRSPRTTRTSPHNLHSKRNRRRDCGEAWPGASSPVLGSTTCSVRGSASAHEPSLVTRGACATSIATQPPGRTPVIHARSSLAYPGDHSKNWIRAERLLWCDDRQPTSTRIARGPFRAFERDLPLMGRSLMSRLPLGEKQRDPCRQQPARESRYATSAAPAVYTSP